MTWAESGVGLFDGCGAVSLRGAVSRVEEMCDFELL